MYGEQVVGTVGLRENIGLENAVLPDPLVVRYGVWSDEPSWEISLEGIRLKSNRNSSEIVITGSRK